MKEKIKKIGQIIIKGVFLISLFLVIGYFIKIITPRYCIITTTRLREYCNWEYMLTKEEQLSFTIALFILVLVVIYFVKKHHERKN